MKICPVLDPAGDPMVVDGIDHWMGTGHGFENWTVGKASPATMPRLVKSSSVRKMQRRASRRARMAVRSFRVMLDPIHEGTVCA